jgi:hypothetical protein
MFTMVPSRMTINWAMPNTPRIHHRRSWLATSTGVWSSAPCSNVINVVMSCSVCAKAFDFPRQVQGMTKYLLCQVRPAPHRTLRLPPEASDQDLQHPGSQMSLDTVMK